MSQVVVGAISDQLGIAAGSRTFWACPADKFRSEQPGDLVLEAGHGGPVIGAVRNLEHRSDKLWAIAEVVDGWDLTRQPWQLSYQLVERRDGWFDLEAIAVVERSATACMPMIKVCDGTLADASRGVVYQHGVIGSLIRNAHEDSRRRKRGEPIEIRRAAPKVVEPDYTSSWRDYPIETRPARGQGLVPPQFRPGWKPGDIEWSMAGGKVISVY
jgi:hypothetical protein